jgi:mycoredoxin
MVRPVKMLLENSGAAYEYINILQDNDARAQVRAINHGNESVPTVVFPDGSTLTEPSTKILIAKLLALGYQPSRSAIVMAYMMTRAMLLLQVAPLLVLLYLILEIAGVL